MVAGKQDSVVPSFSPFRAVSEFSVKRASLNKNAYHDKALYVLPGTVLSKCIMCITSILFSPWILFVPVEVLWLPHLSKYCLF